MTEKMDIHDEAERITIQRHGPVPEDNTHLSIVAAAVVCGVPYLALMMFNIRGDKVDIALLIAGAAVFLAMRWSNKSARTKWFRANVEIYETLKKQQSGSIG